MADDVDPGGVDENDGARDTAAAPPPAPATAWPARLRAAAVAAAPALGLYLLVRAIGLLVLWIWAEAADVSVPQLLSRADGGWYLDIARDGYDHGPQADRERPWQSNLNFYPLLPMLVRAVAAVTPLGPLGAGLAVSWAAALGAAWGLFAIGAHLHDRRTGILLAAVWGVVPHAVVESMVYTEGLLTAFAAWGLYAVLTRRWLLAAAMCLLAGLARPTAPALIGTVGLAALIAAVRRRDGWRPWAAMALAPLTYLGYAAWVGHRVGRWDGLFRIQSEGWNNAWDGGGWTLRYAREWLAKAAPLDTYLVTLVLLAAVALFVLALLDRQPWQLLVYAGVLLVVTIGTAEYYNARARYLLPAFPLLIPLALGLARTRAARAAVVLAALALASAYVGGYLLIVWRYSP